jgi:uncharacterized damage-inducible protein DinB
MIPILQPIAASFHTTDFTVSLCLGDLQEQDARKRIRGDQGPSIAWEVGHMLDCRYKILGLLGVARESPYTAKFSSQGATDGSGYPTTADYQRLWREVSTDLAAAMEGATQELLNKPVEFAPHGGKTAMDSILFLAWHEVYHVGAVGTIRKELGYPGPAELVMAKSAA